MRHFDKYKIPLLSFRRVNEEKPLNWQQISQSFLLRNDNKIQT